ncbi:MAG: protein kinase [Kofleriaceae bacterium]|nr:protein kinase [Kofleriaceae bacterium]
MAEAEAKLSGDAAKRYRILETLGTGGMGEVFHGQHIELGRDVAIKRLKEEVALDKSVVKRFINEARAVNLIRHENIVEVTDFFTDEKGRVHMVMELLEGRSLGALIHSMAPLPYERVAHIGAQIAEAVYAAHESGVIHRDLKPENVFLIRRKSTHDYVKLLDFGIARLHPSCGGLEATESGIVMGTPIYMPPEQAKGAEVTAAADIYSLGIILYEMLSGAGPFPRTSAVEMMMAHIADEPKPLEVPGLPDEFRELVASCLAKDPGDRPATMQVVVDVLEPLAVATKESEPMGAALHSGDIAGAATWDHSEPGAISVDKPASASFSQIPVSAPKCKRTRNITILTGIVLGLAGLLFLLIRGHKTSDVENEVLVTQPVANESVRSQLDQVMASMGFSPIPLACKSSSEEVMATHLRIAKLLQAGKLGSNSPQDQLASEELDKLAEDIGPETSLWKARTRLQQGKNIDALRFAKQATQACPGMATAYVIAGTAQALSGNHTDAIIELNLAVNIDQNYLDARFNLALSQASSKRAVDAIENLSLLLEADSHYAGARYLRGRSYLQVKKYPEALVDLKMAVASKADHSEAWYLLGFAQKETGNLSEANQAFCRASELGHAKATCTGAAAGQPGAADDGEGWQTDSFDGY